MQTGTGRSSARQRLYLRDVVPATLKTAGSQTITATDTVASSTNGASGSIMVSGATATHLMVSAPSTATAGTSFSFTVTALDQANSPALFYTGTVKFTSSDSTAVLPGNYTFTAADAGSHTFAKLLTPQILR